MLEHSNEVVGRILFDLSAVPFSSVPLECTLSIISLISFRSAVMRKRDLVPHRPRSRCVGRQEIKERYVIPPGRAKEVLSVVLMTLATRSSQPLATIPALRQRSGRNAIQRSLLVSSGDAVTNLRSVFLREGRSLARSSGACSSGVLPKKILVVPRGSFVVTNSLVFRTLKSGLRSIGGVPTRWEERGCFRHGYDSRHKQVK